MITVSKSALKAKMLAYLRHVQETGETIEVTEYRKPVLQITPIQEEKKVSVDDVFGPLRDKMWSDDNAILESSENEWPQLKNDFEFLPN